MWGIRNKLYYRVKPFVPQSLRTALRRRLASRLRAKNAASWPIIPGSERRPENWPGWPHGKRFALVLTHDVETIAGLQKCRELMKLEMELGFRSSFNFVPEGDYNVSSELRQELIENGFEVGIHDLKHDGRLYHSRAEFGRSAGRINHYFSEWGAVGFRSAFMLHKLDWLHDLNIKYDASTFDTDPFEPQPEGCQTIFPFWVSRPPARRSEVRSRGAHSACEMLYPISDERAPGYIELPYTLPQDSTLFLLLREQSPDIWFRKLDWLAEHGGMALVITHPDYMRFDGSVHRGTEYPAQLYRQFLAYIRNEYSDSYWPVLPKQIAAYAHEVIFRSGESLNGAEGASSSSRQKGRTDNRWRLRGKRAAAVVFSYYPSDPRPRRAAEALTSEGVKVDLVCLQKDRTEPRREIINGVNVFRIPLKRHRGGKVKYISQYAIFIVRSFIHLAGQSLIRRYDFVHVHNMPDVLVVSALVPKALGAKVILDLHDPVPELMQTIFNLPEESFSVRLLKRLEKWSIRFADLVLTVNRACERIYTSRSCPPGKIKVVLNSPEDDVFRFQPPGLNNSNGNADGPFVILYHGSLVERNGFDLAVDALELARESAPAARLAVCGERSSFFEKVMESAHRRGLGGNIDYLGVKNRMEIVQAIKSCDLGIVPNRRNLFTEINTPTRIFECLALGKPVIAPNTQGIRDYFGDHELIFFEVGSAIDLARQITFVFTHPEEVQEIVKRGQEIYLAHQWSREKSNLLNLVGELV